MAREYLCQVKLVLLTVSARQISAKCRKSCVRNYGSNINYGTFGSLHRTCTEVLIILRRAGVFRQ